MLSRPWILASIVPNFNIFRNPAMTPGSGMLNGKKVYAEVTVRLEPIEHEDQQENVIDVDSVQIVSEPSEPFGRS